MLLKELLQTPLAWKGNWKMRIENHSFSDEDVGLRTAYADELQLDCDLPDIDGRKYVYFNRDDVLAMAKHFLISPQELVEE